MCDRCARWDEARRSVLHTFRRNRLRFLWGCEPNLSEKERDEMNQLEAKMIRGPK